MISPSEGHEGTVAPEPGLIFDAALEAYCFRLGDGEPMETQTYGDFVKEWAASIGCSANEFLGEMDRIHAAIRRARKECQEGTT